MKTSKENTKMSFSKIALFAAVVALFTSTFTSLAAPEDKDDPQREAEELAEKIRADLAKNLEALDELIKRAMENGGKLEIDDEEFEKLMKRGRAAGDLEGSNAQMAELLKKMLERNSKEDEPAAEPGDIPGLMDRLRRQAGGRGARENQKEHSSVLAEYRPVVKRARRSTALIMSGRKQLALGTVVHADGYLLTKASEVKEQDLSCLLSGGERIDAELVDTYEPLDLALVKINADGLKAAKWSSDYEIEPGSFLAAPGIGEEPIAIGVASVAPRSLSEKTKGFLGVTPEGTDRGVKLARVLEGTPAEKAGLKVGDIVLEVDGEKIPNRAAFHQMIAGRSPKEKVAFKIRRGEEEKSVNAELVSREDFAAQNGGAGRNPRIDRMNTMGGDLSGNRGGYLAALQTDLTLEPQECGGPLVDLDGNVVGINIARSGRVKSFAIPAREIKSLLGDVQSGKFKITDLSDLERIADEAEAAVKRAEAALKAAREAKAAADERLKSGSGE